MFPLKDYGQYKQKVDDSHTVSPMSRSPVFWSSQHIYWKSIVCCSRVEENESRDDRSFVCEANNHRVATLKE